MFDFLFLHMHLIILILLGGVWVCIAFIIKFLIDLIRLQNLRLYGRNSLFSKKNEKQSEDNKNDC